MPKEIMDTTKHIQFLAKLYLWLMAIYIFATLSLQAYLPQELRAFLDAEFERESTQIEDIIFLLILPLVIVHIISLIGFIRSKLWAAKYFVYTTVALTVCTLFIGPYVDHAVAATIDSLLLLITGAILAMLYTTKSAFNQQLKEQDAASGAL